jgi:NAD(P)-dependent dehydrogenase (short-subunit alcohol dehydrogenase family)
LNGPLLSDRIGVVTGAGQGNGAAIARGLAEAGAHVVVTDIVGANGQRTADEIAAAGGSATAMTLDVRDPDACEGLAADIARQVGAISILVNNAGVGSATST